VRLLDALTTGDNQVWFAHTVEHARVALMYMNNLSARVGVRLTSNGHSLQLDDGRLSALSARNPIAPHWRVTSTLMSSGGSVTREMRQKLRRLSPAINATA
jgi:hypothetical protein